MSTLRHRQCGEELFISVFSLFLFCCYFWRPTGMIITLLGPCVTSMVTSGGSYANSLIAEQGRLDWFLQDFWLQLQVYPCSSFNKFRNVWTKLFGDSRTYWFIWRADSLPDLPALIKNLWRTKSCSLISGEWSALQWYLDSEDLFRDLWRTKFLPRIFEEHTLEKTVL